MSIFDHLKEYRVIKISLPRIGGDFSEVEAVAQAKSPLIEVTFLPDQLLPETLDTKGICRIALQTQQATVLTLNAEIKAVVSDTRLQLQALDSTTHQQKRAYFRVDADLSISYWTIDNGDSEPCAVQTVVNISGGGIRIPVNKELSPGRKVGMEIILETPQMRVIECVAKVVRTFSLGGTLQAAMSFSDIEEDDQDAIVAYCFAEQRRQLRLKVHIMGNAATG